MNFRLVCLTLVLGVFSTQVDLKTISKDANLDVLRVKRQTHESLKVGVIEQEPFVIKDSDGKYRGMLIDLWKKIAENLNIKYDVIPSTDGRYGKRYDDGHWDGLVGDVLNKKADIGVAAMTITENRQKELAFTEPFMNLHVVGVGKASDETLVDTYYRSDSAVVTFVGIVIIFVVGLVLNGVFKLLAHRRQPIEEGECQRPGFADVCLFPCNSFRNTSAYPISTTLVSGTWVLFLLLSLAVFAAQLGYYGKLSDGMSREHASTLEQMIAMKGSKFITLSGGSTRQFIEESSEPVIVEVRKKMDKQATEKVTSSQQGIEDVKKGGKTVMFLESPWANKEVNNDCSLMILDPALAPRKYGLMMRKGDNLYDRINAEVSSLVSSGFVDDLTSNWKLDKPDCPRPRNQEIFTLRYMVCIFVVAIVGYALGLVAFFFECLCAKRSA